jgi:hypothetical protein
MVLDEPTCQCSRINTQAAIQPMQIGLYSSGKVAYRVLKDGIGSAYRSAKAAASCAILEGIAEDFRRYYSPLYRRIELDNHFGRFIFLITYIIQRVRFARKAMLQMVVAEQVSGGAAPRMSNVLWDTFTGSAPYLDVFLRVLHPAFICRFAWGLVVSAIGG